MVELTQEQKDSMWSEMDKHLGYLKGTNELGTSYKESIFYIKEMLKGWIYIGERDVAKYQAVLSDTTRLDLEAQLLVSNTSKEYLSSTDWYITRQAETGAEVPSDILTKRAEARKNA